MNSTLKNFAENAETYGRYISNASKLLTNGSFVCQGSEYKYVSTNAKKGARRKKKKATADKVDTKKDEDSDKKVGKGKSGTKKENVPHPKSLSDRCFNHDFSYLIRFLCKEILHKSWTRRFKRVVGFGAQQELTAIVTRIQICWRQKTVLIRKISKFVSASFLCSSCQKGK